MQERCRVCLNTGRPMLNLFDSKSEHGITLAEMFVTTSGVAAERYDRWPQSICTTCLMTMIDAYEIKMLIIKNLGG